MCVHVTTATVAQKLLEIQCTLKKPVLRPMRG